MTVIRRGGHALLRHEAGGAGQALWALTAERLRPYTEQEAAAFLRLHQALRRALPRYRAELDEIAALHPGSRIALDQLRSPRSITPR
ncbi:hypothetical protein [Streptomyces bluensis]|uniref:Uncharacterized protein n=1 Tax=Streptomyces bluensis TaxID=33897 RepID=A0ABW6UGV8_9ACTN